MKKRAVFLVLSLLVLIFFGCDYKIPSAIEFKWSPTIRFADKKDIGEMFTDLLNEAINGDEAEGMDIVPCTNTENVTFIIHMDLFDKLLVIDEDSPELPEFPGIDLQDLFDDLVGDETITLEEDRDLINSGEPMTLPLSSIGSYLNDFTFKDLKTKLYFSGSSVVAKLKIDVAIVEVDENDTGPAADPVYETISHIANESSSFNSWGNGYPGTTAPSGGSEITVPINGKDIAVFFKVVIPEGTELELADLDDGFLKVEVVVWLPFVFEAGVNGAVIEFPPDALFSSTDDLFGREKAGDENMLTDIVESLSLQIMLDNNPFEGAELVILSKGIEIKNPLTSKSFPFTLSVEDMKKINNADNFPFTPNFKIVFDPRDTIRFPREFNAVGFVFHAKIKYKMDL